MRLERSPIADLIISRHSKPNSYGYQFWQDQLGSGATFDQWRDSVHYVSLKQLNTKEEAEDNTQDTFESALKAADQFRGGNPKAWLLRIAVNKGYDTLRRKKGKAQTSLQLKLEESGDKFKDDNPSQDPQKAAERNFVREAIADAMKSLPAEQRDAVFMSDIEGLPYKTIASELGVAEGTIKSRVFRGRNRLRKDLREVGITGFDFLDG